MAELYRKRYNGVDAITLQGGGITNSATSITFNAALQSMGANIATLGTDEYLPLVIDNEVIYLTAYTAAATTGTISRGKEGTTGASHSAGANVIHGPTVADFTSTPLAYVAYLPATVVDGAAIPTSLGDVDATHLVVTFTAPASGQVEVVMSMMNLVPVGNQMWWTLRSGSTEVTGARAYMSYGGGTLALRLVYVTMISGLTPGNSYTWKWAMVAAGSGGLMYYGDDGSTRNGPAIMKVTPA